MADYVLDCSALVAALIGTDAAADEVRNRAASARLHAPHLIDAETGQVLRRKAFRGEIPASVVPGRLSMAALVIHERYPHAPFAARAWQLRDNISYYDALYVALAARLRLPLLTMDQKLASTRTELPCSVQCVPAEAS